MSSSAPATVTVLLHANLVDLATDEQARQVTAAGITCLSGHRLRVRARRYVLACGGIENPRILLLADSVAPQGLGNGHGVVGRYYMEHPHVSTGRLLLFDPELDLGLYTSDEGALVRLRRLMDRHLGFGRPAPMGTTAGIAVAAAAQRRDRILGCSYLLGGASAPDQDDQLLPGIGSIGRRPPPDAPDRGFRVMRLYARSEQAPNPDSRISLGEARDAPGLRQVRHDWRLLDLDRRTLAHATRLLGRAVGASGLGRVRTDEWLRADDGGWEGLQGWGHPLGTTRMHDDPKRGVVDRNSRVHSVDNLYVAGGSVFPTSGTAHPTLTIVALSYRLAEHLKELHRRSASPGIRPPGS